MSIKSWWKAIVAKVANALIGSLIEKLNKVK